MAELADALDSGSSDGNIVEVQVLLSAPSSERTLLRSDFSFAKKNQSHASSFLLFREKSRSVRLLVCKRTRDGSQSLSTFHDIASSAQPKSPAATEFVAKSCKNTRTKTGCLTELKSSVRHPFFLLAQTEAVPSALHIVNTLLPGGLCYPSCGRISLPFLPYPLPAP